MDDGSLAGCGIKMGGAERIRLDDMGGFRRRDIIMQGCISVLGCGARV